MAMGFEEAVSERATSFVQQESVSVVGAWWLLSTSEMHSTA
jgi:hypothetical protein